MQEPQPKAIVSVYDAGSTMTVKRPSYSGASKGGPGGPRGSIKAFSRASRRRLLRRVAKLDRDVLPVFATLTYPSAYPADPEEWKRHLNSIWAKRLRRVYPNAGYIWRLEFQRRGAPHFHLILYGIDGSLDVFRKWLSATWYDAVASGDEKHLRAGTNARQTRSSRGTMKYMAKEVGKTHQAKLSDDYPDGIGRWWGVKYKNALPWSGQTYRTIEDATADKLMRLMRHIAELRGREYHSLTIFTDGRFWKERLDDVIELFESGDDALPPRRPLASLQAAEDRIKAQEQ